MSTAMAPTHDDAKLLEQVVIHGDLAKLTPAERVHYFRRVCDSLGLNPLTKPFMYITLNGKLTLYATRDATDQLRRRDEISIRIMHREKIDDLYCVTAQATNKDGRNDESVGAVNITALKGEPLANAMMKAETKAKRRVTLSICGLGWLDELEVQSVPEAVPANVDTETGEIKETRKDAMVQLNLSREKVGLTADDLRKKAVTLFGKSKFDDLTDEEVSALADEVEVVVTPETEKP